MKVSKRIIPLFMVFAILISCISIPAHAEDDGDDDDITTGSNFFQWIASQGGLIQKIIGYIPFTETCPDSPDAKHHYNYYNDNAWLHGYVNMKCDYCGKIVEMKESDLKSAYNQMVQEMPIPSINSNGELIWEIPMSGVRECHNGYGPSGVEINKDGSINYYDYKNGCTFDIATQTLYINRSIKGLDTVDISFSGAVPVDGLYIAESQVCAYAGSNSFVQPYSFTSQRVYYGNKIAGQEIGSNTSQSASLGIFRIPKQDVSNLVITGHLYCTVIPTSADSVQDQYNVNSRPTSINGNVSYYDVNGNLQISKDTTIVNETNNTFYNPITNETYDMSGWTYDYTTRTYNITTNNGDNVSVTYGDTNVTINNGGNTYILYYYVVNNGGESCQHEYVVSRENPATCTQFGSRVYSCSKCNHTYSEVLPALGHDWQFVETVEAETDEDGNETKAAYDLYRCSRCNEERQVAVGEKPGNEKPDTPSDAGSWAALFKWLDDFKKWLGNLLGDKDADDIIEKDDNGDLVVEIENEDGEKEKISLDSIKAKFRWWRDVVAIGQMFLNEVSASEQAAYAYYEAASVDGAPVSAVSTGAPSIKLNLGAAQSNYGYVYGSEVEMLDLSWYTPYKKTVDDLVSGFLWLLFLWSLFKRAPSIISGGEIVATKSEDLSNGYRSKRGK